MPKLIIAASLATIVASAFSLCSFAAAPNLPLTIYEVKNALGCLPSLADPPDAMVQFKSGKFSSKDYPFAEIRSTALGVINGSQVAVADVCWNTGGSGNWEVVEIFRREKGHVVGDKVYWPEDLPEGGTMVGRIEIKNNKIYLYGEAPMENRKIKKPKIINLSAFTNYRK